MYLEWCLAHSKFALMCEMALLILFSPADLEQKVLWASRAENWSAMWKTGDKGSWIFEQGADLGPLKSFFLKVTLILETIWAELEVEGHVNTNVEKQGSRGGDLISRTSCFRWPLVPLPQTPPPGPTGRTLVAIWERDCVHVYCVRPRHPRSQSLIVS